MRLRITKVDEYQFLTCFKFSLWGSKTARFKDWRVGDYLVFIVDKALAGYAEVSGTAYVSNKRVWDNGLFPHRLPIVFKHVLAPEDRIPILGDIRDILVSAWGIRYGWGILNQRIISDLSAEKIINKIVSGPNSISYLKNHLEELLEDALQQRKNSSAKAITKKTALQKVAEEPTIETFSSLEDTTHTQAQNALIKLGRITGCSVWVASNDRNRSFRGRTLGEQCLAQLPNLGLSDEATRKIALIDVIWIKQNAPVCAFEVETTTSIYSGLLRMSDLISVVPALNVKLYIVAPRERQDRVGNELTRPTFRRIGLNDFCKFIPLEDLNDLLPRVEGFGGCIQPSIVDKIAIGYEEKI